MGGRKGSVILDFMRIRGVFMLVKVMVFEVGLMKIVMFVVFEIVVKSFGLEVVNWGGDFLVLGVFEGCVIKSEDGKFLNFELEVLDVFVGGLLSVVVFEEEFIGKSG